MTFRTSPINIPTRGYVREQHERRNNSPASSFNSPQEFCCRRREIHVGSWSSAPASTGAYRNRSRASSDASHPSMTSEEEGRFRSNRLGSFSETIVEDLDDLPFDVETTIERIETIKTRSLAGEEQEKTTMTRTVRKIASASTQYNRKVSVNSTSTPEPKMRRSSIPVLINRKNSVPLVERSTFAGFGRPGQTPRREPRVVPDGIDSSGES